MWAWRSVLCVSLVCGLALDSNTIRSSKEAAQSVELPDPSHGDRADTNSNSRRRASSSCSGPNCNAPPGGSCSNRAQRRPPSPSDRLTDSHRDDSTLNRTKGVEMASCVRSVDCSAGLCCVRYLTGKRCQRIPGEGEACLLRAATKLRRNLGRCDCAAGLACTAAAATAATKSQGVCATRPKQGQRKTRHSGRRRRPAAGDGSC